MVAARRGPRSQHAPAWLNRRGSGAAASGGVTSEGASGSASSGAAAGGSSSASSGPVGVSMDALFDRLATTGGKSAQAPACIFTHASGGRLWLGGLPTRATQDKFPRVALQIVCFAESWGSRGGCELPGALVKPLPIADPNARGAAWRDTFPILMQSLACGESVLEHCMAGRHRAAGAGTLSRAILAGESLNAAEEHISQRRDVEITKLMRQGTTGQWVRDTLRACPLPTAWPAPANYAVTSRSSVHVMAERAPLCSHRQRGGGADRLVGPTIVTDLHEAIAWQRPFCAACLRRSPASWHPR